MAAKSTSPYRQLQAQQTRERIADAAEKLFATDGFGATSIDAIASEAGVALRTVYAVYGTKREILSAISTRWVARWNPMERAQAVIAEPNARRRLRAAAHWVRSLYEDGYGVINILETAADEAEETRALLRTNYDERDAAMNAMVDSLGDKLRRPPAEAQSIFRALGSPGVYRELVLQSGWSHDLFEEWIADALVRQLVTAQR
jgi:AcrR family transcriptional regulator